MSLARGLDYYTGVIYEAILTSKLNRDPTKNVFIPKSLFGHIARTSELFDFVILLFLKLFLQQLAMLP